MRNLITPVFIALTVLVFAPVGAGCGSDDAPATDTGAATTGDSTDSDGGTGAETTTSGGDTTGSGTDGTSTDTTGGVATGGETTGTETGGGETTGTTATETGGTDEGDTTDTGGEPPECTEDAECDQSVVSGPCEVVTCDTDAGKCAVVDAPDDSACDTESACVTAESCQTGACVGPDLDCDDEDACTEDACHVAAGCQHTPLPDCCTPKCADKGCGPDGCGGLCGECPEGAKCTASQTCCTPACDGKQCGGDGCGGLCGSCPQGQTCGGDGQCGCSPSCAEKDCGDDGCGGGCGSCTVSENCSASGECFADDCVADCTGLQCGSDGCGGMCGTCDSDSACLEAVCDEGICGTVAIEAPCEDGLECTIGDACIGGICQGLAASDVYEPNDSWAGYHLLNQTDCDSVGSAIQATAFPADDVDWYWYSVADEGTLCDVQPLITVTPPAGTSLQLCAYFQCSNGNPPNLSCNGITTTIAGPVSGSEGCCVFADGEAASIKLSPQCGTFAADDGFIDIRVTSLSGVDACGAYTLDYKDD